MRIYFFICLVMICANLSANEWKTSWIEAIEACDNKDFVTAEHSFNIAIMLMERQNDMTYPYVYVDRARLFLLLNQNEKALQDVNQAIDSQNLKGKELIRAIATRITARGNLGCEDGYDADLAILVSNSDIEMVEADNKLVIRNIPKCPAFREAITQFLIYSGTCNTRDDVKFLSSDICIVNQFCQQCKYAAKIEQRTIEGCKSWCDANTIAAATWCSTKFRDPRCIGACNLAVFGIQKGCHWCCNEGAFYDKCVKPFADILGEMSKYIQSPCDPAWD